ncbi:MAG: Gfo/Idh/MocA family oxidoreductase [Candidatus Latescibacterota bacterium]|nr:Gfo/Idh/MocA family oxidoreductase [Candidatus Latescibacterota bacterium]
MSDLIRVGLIRCDTHGAYYAALCARHDPLRLQHPLPIEREARYSWQHGGAHFYFYTNYGDPRHMSVEFVDGFVLAKVWDEDRAAAECLAEIFDDQPEVCDDFAAVSDDVDLVLVADCNGDGSDHLELARPGLEKGVATFVDKPLALTMDDARALVQLAAKHRAPMTSISILRALPAAELFARRLAEVGAVQLGSVQGGGTAMAGHIHAASLALTLFGEGVERVRAMGDTALQTVHLSYGDREDRPRRGVTLSCDVGETWHCAFHASAYGPGGAIHSPPLSDWDFPFGAAAILRIVREMVETRQSPAIIGAMLEGVAICAAARQAQETGVVVQL